MEPIAQYVSRVANETYGHSRRLMPEQPWWNNLDPAFHKFPDDFYLDLKSQAMVDATAVVDLGMRTALATMALGAGLPTTLWPGRFQADRAQWDFYKRIADQHDPGHAGHGGHERAAHGRRNRAISGYGHLLARVSPANGGQVNGVAGSRGPMLPRPM